MKKYLKIGLSALLAIGLLAACNSKETKNDNPATEQQATPQGEEATFPLTMTDVTGKDITLEAPPERIISSYRVIRRQIRTAGIRSMLNKS